MSAALSFSPPLSLLTLQERYKRDGLAYGETVQEWETAMGLPPYTVYPGARRAQEGAIGFGMYSEAYLASWHEETKRVVACLRALGLSYISIGQVMGLTEIQV